MAYEVYLGGCALYGVSSVEESASRGVTEHDGIGSGAFAIPQNAGLKNWSIRLELTQQNLGQEGWRRASEVLDELRNLLKNKNEQRLVIISDRQKLSKPVLLRDLKYETSYQGVYSVTLSLIEYVKGQVKASGVPSVTRPGTRPKVPDSFKVASAFDNTRPDPIEVPDSSIEYPLYVDPNTNKPTNLAGLDGDAPVSVVAGNTGSLAVFGPQRVSGEISSIYDSYEATINWK